MFKTSLNEIRTSRGRSMKITVIKQEEQRYERNERQKHRTASGGTVSEY